MAGRADTLIPRRTVAHTDVELIEFRIVDDGIVNGAAAAELPEVAEPGRPGPLLQDVVRDLPIRFGAGIARHGVEAPHLGAASRVIGRDEPAHAIVRTAIADDDLAVDHPRRAGNRVGFARNHRQTAPQELAGRGVQRDQSTVECADVHLTVIVSGAPIDHVATR